MIDLKAKIYVAGHKGLVGSAILRKLNKRGYKKIITENKSKLDLTNQSKVYNFIKKYHDLSMGRVGVMYHSGIFLLLFKF